MKDDTARPKLFVPSHFNFAWQLFLSHTLGAHRSKERPASHDEHADDAFFTVDEAFLPSLTQQIHTDVTGQRQRYGCTYRCSCWLASYYLPTGHTERVCWFLLTFLTAVKVKLTLSHLPNLPGSAAYTCRNAERSASVNGWTQVARAGRVTFRSIDHHQ